MGFYEDVSFDDNRTLICRQKLITIIIPSDLLHKIKYILLTSAIKIEYEFYITNYAKSVVDRIPTYLPFWFSPFYQRIQMFLPKPGIHCQNNYDLSSVSQGDNIFRRFRTVTF